MNEFLDLKMIRVYLIAVKRSLVLKNRIESKIIALFIEIKTDLCTDKTVNLADKCGQTLFHLFHVVLLLIVISDIPKNNVLNHRYNLP